MLRTRASFAGSGVGCRHKDNAVNAARRRTVQWFAFDSHKHYTSALAQDEAGKVLREADRVTRTCTSWI